MNQSLFSNFHIKIHSENEKVLFVLHRHWFNMLTQFLIVFLILGVLLAGLFLSPFFIPRNNPALFTFFLFIENIFILIAWVYSFLVWIDYYFDIWIITNERIINVEQKGLFLRSVSELNLSKVQDVTTEVEGVLPTILNFGDVFVQTAGETERFLFRQIPDPYKIKNEIMKLHRETEQHQKRQSFNVSEKQTQSDQ